MDGLEGIDGLDYFSRYKPAAEKAKYEAEKRGYMFPQTSIESEVSLNQKQSTEKSFEKIKVSESSREVPDYKKMAKELGVEEEVIRAIVSVESSGSGFTKEGGPVLRFEGHQFKKYLTENDFDVAKLEKVNSDLIYDYSKSKSKKHGGFQYEKAMKIDQESTMMATSYGAFQIMGFNFEASGFESVERFVKAQSTTAGQVKAFINFVKSNPKRLEAMKDKDFAEFARLYNGEDYAKWNYDIKMQKSYNKLIKKEK